MGNDFHMNAKWAGISIVLFLAWVYLFWVLLHEAGHALVALMYGNTIDTFAVLSPWPHVSLVYPFHFTVFGWGLFFVAGEILPMLVGALAICFYKPNIKSKLYHIFFKITAEVMPAIVVAFWVVLPILSLFMSIPPVVDTAQFLVSTGIHPLLIALVAVAAASAFRFLAHKKGIKSIFESIFETQGIPQDRKKTSRVGYIIFALFHVGMITLFALVIAPQSPSMPGEVIFSMDTAWEDVRLEPQRMDFTFDVENTEWIHIIFSAEGQGFVTVVAFYNERGELEFTQTSEKIDRRGGFWIGGLDTVVHTLSLIFLMDIEELEKYFSNIGYSNPDFIEYTRGIFAYSSDDYSFTFFIEIREGR